jgi:murein DD-endopeptidase MepM/ murein hydrolase activator NlpD
MRHQNYFITVLAIIVILFGTHAVYAAEDISDLQKQITERRAKIDGIQQQIDAMKKALQAKQLEKTSLQNQLGIIGGRIEKGKLALQNTKNQLQETALVLKETELGIEKKKQAIDEEQNQIGELVRALDFSERQTVVAIFARGKTLSDFFSAQDAVRAVDTELTRSLIKVMLAKQDLDQQKTKLSTVKAALEDQKDELQTKQEQLSSQSQAKAQLLLQTKQSEEKFQKMVSDLKREYSATEGEIEAIDRKVRERLKNQGKTVSTGPVALSWPTPSRKVTASYHDPDYPFRHVFEHPGIDLRAAQGTAIRAAGNGIIARAKNAGMGYSYIIIIHNNKISTLYGHMSRILVKEDDVVSAGDTIGYSGGTPGTPGAGPFVTGAHLHFEVRQGGIPVNPLDYLP